MQYFVAVLMYQYAVYRQVILLNSRGQRFQKDDRSCLNEYAALHCLSVWDSWAAMCKSGDDGLFADKAFLIEIPHVYCLEYKEGKRIMMVEIDFREERQCLQSNQIKRWNPPYDGEDLDDGHREKILSNIYNYLTVSGFNVMVQR